MHTNRKPMSAVFTSGTYTYEYLKKHCENHYNHTDCMVNDVLPNMILAISSGALHGSCIKYNGQCKTIWESKWGIM